MAVRRRNVKPNEFKSYKVTINGNDVSKLIGAIDVFQDVFSPNWTGSIMLIDAVNIQNSSDVAVGNKVNIDITSDTPLPCGGVSSKSFSFVIHSISNKTLIKKNIYGYELELVATDSIKDIKTRVSKSFKKKKVEEIVKDIIQEKIGGSIQTSSSQEKFDVIIPNMTPFTAINYVANFSQKQNKEPDWVFFQSDFGSYKFKSLDEMFSDGTGYKLIHSEANYRDNEKIENPDAFIKMQKYSFVSEFDGMKNLVNGMFGNKVIAHDIINKKIVESEYTYSKDNSSDKTNKPFTGSDFEDAQDSAISYMTLHDGMTSTTRSFHENHDKWEGARRSAIHKLDTNRLLVEVAGGACWWKAIGKKIDVELPSQEDISGETNDKYYKGSYVVLAIKHNIIGNNYKITMELGKKRLAKSLG